MTRPHTHYDTLQVARTASDAVIRVAYRALAQQNHPDKHPGNESQAVRQMVRINEAYKVLSDPTLRAGYDDGLVHAEHDPHPEVKFERVMRDASTVWGPEHFSQTVQWPPQPHPDGKAPPVQPSEDPWALTRTPSRRPAPRPAHTAADWHGPDDGGRLALPFHWPAWARQPWPWLGLGAVLVVTSLAWAWARLGQPPASSPARKAPLAVAAAVPQVAAPAAAARPAPPEADKARQLYAEAVREVELKHPALDPKSPLFRKALVDEVKSRAYARLQQGIPAHLALRQAVEEMEQAQAASGLGGLALEGDTSPRISGQEPTAAEQLAVSVACGHLSRQTQEAAYQACTRHTLAKRQP